MHNNSFHQINADAELRASRERCRAAGLQPDGAPRRVALEQGELRRRRKESELVLESLREVVGLFVHSAPDQPRQVFFVDHQGYVLDTIDGNARADMASGFPWAEPGESWIEPVMGTNAAALALMLDSPVMARGKDHYLNRFAGYGNCAAPVRESGQCVGALVLATPACAMGDKLCYMVGAAAQAVEREVQLKRLASRYAAQNRMLVLLNEVTLLFNSVAYSDRVLLTVAERIGALTGITRFDLFSVSPDSETLAPMGSWPSQRLAEQEEASSLGAIDPLLREAVERVEPLTIPSEADSAGAGGAGSVDGRSTLYLPIIFNGAVSAVVRATNYRCRDINLDEMLALRTVGAQFGALLERVRLHRSLVQESHKLRATLDTVDVGVVLIDVRSGSFVWNHRMDELFDKCHPLSGEPVHGICPERYMRWPIRFAGGDSEAGIRQALASADSVTEEAVLLSDYPRTFRVTTGPVGGEAGEVRWVVRTYTDVTRYRELERVKSELIAMISHELRTPITAILGYSDLLIRLMPDKVQESQHLAEGLHREAGELAGLVERVLAVTRLDVGLDRGAFREVRLGPLLTEIIDLLSLEAKTKGVEIVHRCTGELRVIGDREGLRRAFMNLVHNAIKFSAPDATVVVKTALTASGVEVSVADEGPGIPDEHLEHIFERFYRVQSPETVGLPGSGLGLYVVKGIVEQHGGQVTVESQLGQGAVFKVSLPGWEVGNDEKVESTGSR